RIGRPRHPVQADHVGGLIWRQRVNAPTLVPVSRTPVHGADILFSGGLRGPYRGRPSLARTLRRPGLARESPTRRYSAWRSGSLFLSTEPRPVKRCCLLSPVRRRATARSCVCCTWRRSPTT